LCGEHLRERIKQIQKAKPASARRRIKVECSAA
jgi:hypothetical protein